MLIVVDCIHCGDPLPKARAASLQRGEPAFCCAGCSTVYRLLKDRGLDREFYALPDRPKKIRFEMPAHFQALDLVARQKIDFFIEGIHCSSCLWILERLPEFCPEVQSARLDMGRSVLRVIRKKSGGFSKIAETLHLLGYPAHAMDSLSEAEIRLQSQDRQTLKRIGVSAFSAMNVMVYSFSLYWGVEGTLAVWFRWFSIFVSLPALIYGAWPFYQNTYRALKAKRISMDLPISLAMIGGLVESLRQILLGTNLLYLDSVTMLVTLLLLSRYILSRLERAEGSKSGVIHTLLPASVKKADGQVVSAFELGVGDEIICGVGETIPADGILIAGSLELNEAFLTGESRVVRKGMLMSVWAGSLVVDGQARMRVERIGAKTRLGEISDQVDFSASTLQVKSEKSDRWAEVFMGSVLGFSILLVVLFGREDLGEAIKRSLSLLLVACPCALALATPLALARGFRLAAESKILIRQPEILESAPSPRHIVFDKTGTLTLGKPKIHSSHWLEAGDTREGGKALDDRSILYSLELHSRHPYAESIVQFLENQDGIKRVDLERIREIPGQGVEGFVGNDRFFVGRAQRHSEKVEFLKNQSVLAEMYFSDVIKPEASELVQSLKKQGYTLHILSGDAPQIVEDVAQTLGISSYRGALLPHEKLDRVRELKKSGSVLMLGDGINDLPALSEADLGIAMNRSVGGALQAALGRVPIIFLESNLLLLSRWLDLSRDFQSTTRRNLWLSFAYNLTGASLAVSGWVHPLVAAIAMPVSSLTVFLSTVYGMRRSRA